MRVRYDIRVDTPFECGIRAVAAVQHMLASQAVASGR
jgi:hypothetical protein